MKKITYNNISGHRIFFMIILCLFGLYLVRAVAGPRKHRKKVDERVYLLHADVLKFDQYGPNPGAQIVKGHVAFKHMGASLRCDSAYFYQESNSVKAFGHVFFKQGDTLSLSCERAFYDGQWQKMEARKNVVLHHRHQVLKTDSLDFDRLYNIANFMDGGTLIDGKERLVADWGEYNTDTRQAAFYYNVKLKSPRQTITTDTLYYDVAKSKAHIVGPGSKIRSKQSVVTTQNAYYDTKREKAELFGRSTIVDGDKTITADTLYYVKDGNNRAYGNVIYKDLRNRNSLTCGYLRYNEKKGYGFATKNPVAKEYSRKDTLYMHSDSMKIYTFNINTDSVYRKVHAFPHVRVFRNDVQAVCDSLVFNTADSCMTMYKDPITWNGKNRQLLGEQINVYMNDSTVRKADVLGQALSVELLSDGEHYNQITSKVMHAYFDHGKIKEGESIGNVQSVYYPINDKDSSLMMLNYLETDTMRVFMSPEQKVQKIWTSKFSGVGYPMTQIPPTKSKLPNFAWYDYIRPINKDDIYEWRSKRDGNLKIVQRHAAPLQKIESSEEKPREKGNNNE